ncbi:MAG TPA: glycosyltransferase family 9 protein [Candidatus Angelobacter sp.]|nr:glycosyltransferase family 9 protein [Candidatus Angelobacter sp.]
MSRPRVLMLRPLGLGDLLTAVPAMRGVARAFPDHDRLLAAPAVLTPLAALSGAIDRVVDVGPLQPLPPECDEPDVAIDLHGRGPASHRLLLAARPWRLIAFANAQVSGTERFPRWREAEHEVGRWCRLLSENGIPADPSNLDLDPPPNAPPHFAVGATVIHPGAAYPARRWPPDRWVSVAAALGPNVVITGARAERELGLRIGRAAGIDDERIVAGRTDLLELAAIVATARRVISTDTGIAHLATALRTPSVILFGPTPPSRWGPPPDRPWHRVLWKGRTGDANAMTPDPGLLAIGIDEVLTAAATLDSRMGATA